MKIGLITIWSVPNYGSVLQCFATQQLLESMGHECKVIEYVYPNEWNYHQGLPRPKRNLLRTALRALGLKAQHRKSKILEHFRKEYFHFTQRFDNLDALRSADWSDYGCFVSGSDQLWNARYTMGDSAFLLSFVPSGICRVSLASSFALKELPVEYVDKYRKELLKYSALSVREENGRGIIRKQLGIDKSVFVCLDPTLLLSKDEWLKILPSVRHALRKPYILLYMWTYAFEPRPYIFEVIRHFQRQLNCDVIALEGYTPEPQAGGVKMQCAEDSTLPEFMELFAGASLVITSSFHGTAFAVNFERPLLSIVPDNVGDDRQSSFLRSVGAEESIARIGQSLDRLNPYYNTEKVSARLKSLRTECLHWISINMKIDR